MRFFKTPSLFRNIYPEATWRGSAMNHEIFLTFDDGPIPGVTEYILDILAEEEINATFFCVGDNVRKHPAIFNRIIKEGHQAANHTFNHLDSWKIKRKKYLENIDLCEKIFREQGYENEGAYFRPPYGRLSLKTYRRLKTEFKIIMWDVLSYDFASDILPSYCLDQCINHTEPGSIIVFHDSKKSGKLLKVIIQQYIQHFKALNYQFSTVNKLFLDF